MLVFGVLLVACFVAPWAVGGEKTVFSWTQLGVEGIPWSQKLIPILMIATGIISVGLGALKLSITNRAFAATGIGLAPLLYQIVNQSTFVWQVAVGGVAGVVLVSGLVLRSRYPEAKIGRMLATIGALGVIALYLIPSHGAMPIKGLFTNLGDLPGKAKLIPIVGMGGAGIVAGLIPLLLTVAAFAVWMPAPGRAGSGALAWTILFWGLVASIVGLLVGPEVVASLKSGLSQVFYMPIAQAAWMSLACFGIAGVIGSQIDV